MYLYYSEHQLMDYHFNPKAKSEDVKEDTKTEEVKEAKDGLDTDRTE